MEQITLHWTAQSSAPFASMPRPIGGLMVTITPRKKIVEHNGVSVLMRPARGETDNTGVLVTMPLATEGIKIPDVDSIWDVTVSGSQHVTAFTFPIHPFGKGADQQLAELETLPTKPEDSELGLWLDIAADVLDSREAAEKALSEAGEAGERAAAALAEAEAAIVRAANTVGKPGKDGDKGPGGDPGRDGVDVRNVVRVTSDEFPGITSSADVLQEAVNSIPVNANAIFDGIYTVNKTVYWPTGRYYDFKAAKFIADVGEYVGGAMFISSQDFEAPRPVTVLTEVATTIDDVAGVRVARATVPGFGSTFAKNDTVKVISDDVIPGGHFTSNDRKPRLGEFAKVHAVAGDSITLRSTFVDPFVTNIRISKLPVATVTFDGGEFDVTDAVVSSKLTVHFIRLIGLTKPKVISPRWIRLMGMGVSAKSCDGYYVINPSCDFAINEESTASFGYGIHDSSSRDGRISGGQFNSMRHGYTDGTNFSLANNTNPADYGCTMNTKVTDSVGRYCTAGAFDTHSMAYGVEFNNVTSYSASNTHGVQLRGRNCSVNGLANYGGYSAVFLFTQATTSGGSSWSPGESFGHTLNAITTHGSTMVLYVRIRTDVAHPFYDQRTTYPTCVANNVTAWNTPNLVNSQNGKIVGSNWNWFASKNIAGSVLSLQNTDIDLSNVIYDMTAVETISSTAYLSNVDASASGRTWSSRVRITNGKVIDNAVTSPGVTPLYRAANTATTRVELSDHYAPLRASSATFSSIATAVVKRVRWYNDTTDFTS